MRARFASLPLLLVLVMCCPVRSQERPEGLSEREAQAVDRAVLAEMERQEVVGVAIGIVRDGEVAYLHGYGMADREANVHVTEDTLFRWASISKPITAIAALQLAEDDKLDLDADVQTYVPEFPDKGVTITSRQLLGHLGGIVHYDGVVARKREYDAEHPFEDVVRALDTFADSKLVGDPGERYSYSTHGYILLSAVVQRAGGEPFIEQVRERIIEPLGLATLQPDYQWEAIPNRAVGYRKRRGTVERSSDTDVSWKLGGGGFISSVGDLAKFAAGLINHRLVDESTEEVMWTSLTDAAGKSTGYGLGFGVGEDGQGRRTISHNGAQEKTRTRMLLYPEERYAIVVMCNSEYSEPNRFTQVIDHALNRRREGPSEAKPAEAEKR